MKDIDKHITNEDYARYYDHGKDVDLEYIKRHNDAIVNKTINDFDEDRKKKVKSYNDLLSERIEAASDFIAYQEKGGNGGVDPVKYFGKRYLAKLRGQKILQILKQQSNGQVVVELDEIY